MGKLGDIESYDEQSPKCQSWTSLLIWSAVSYCCMLAIFISVCFPELSLLKLGLLPIFFQGTSPAPFYAFSPHGSGYFAKPTEFEIVALVPFHQLQRTEILDCYLQRNLVRNNGLVDQVLFIPQTNDTESLQWLTSLIEKTPVYNIWPTGNLPVRVDGVSKDTLFIWIDGDIVFFEDHTIPTIVKTKLDQPKSLVVSANVVNQAVLKALHSHPSVALSYRPELYPVQHFAGQESWRASTLPPWNGPASFQIPKDHPLPYPSHRWLPSNDDDFELTPIGMSIYSDSGPGFDHWTVSAQQHYSFLQHLELGDLYRYKFPLWKNPANPISQSFFCFYGHDATHVQSFIQHSDSPDLEINTGDSSMDQHIIIDGKGLAAHYFTGQSFGGLEQTDILSRYRSYAKEMVCPA